MPLLGRPCRLPPAALRPSCACPMRELPSRCEDKLTGVHDPVTMPACVYAHVGKHGVHETRISREVGATECVQFPRFHLLGPGSIVITNLEV